MVLYSLLIHFGNGTESPDPGLPLISGEEELEID